MNQTYTNLEIILVDDGSPDNCPAICDEWAKKDDRIKVIHKKNGGLSSARNAGLDIAHGEYIGFVDSDDYIKPEMYQRLYEVLIENDADMSICKVCLIDESGNEIVRKKWFDEVVSGEQMLMYILRPRMSRNKADYVVAWNKLYKAYLWKNFRYNDGYIHEDQYAAHHIAGACRKVAVSSKELYVHLKRGNSIMGERMAAFSPKSFEGELYAYKDRYEYLLSIGRPDLAELVYENFSYALRYLFNRVNYFQYRKKLGGLPGKTLKKLLLSGELGSFLRGIKFAICWGLSIFRPFVNKEMTK